MNSSGYLRGIDLFNQGSYYDAHEVLEDVWREARGDEKKFLQGLIQVAVAFHHHSTGNLVGARSLLGRARKNLAADPGEFGVTGLTDFLELIDRWHQSWADGRALPERPRLVVRRG